jgi:hypothetical protein
MIFSVKVTVTLKAFANFSPGLLQPWEQISCSERSQLLKSCDAFVVYRMATQPFQGCAFE